MADSDPRALRSDHISFGHRLTMVVDLPPSVNHLYFTDQRGRRLLTQEGRAYRQHVEQTLMTQRARLRCPDPPYEIWMWFLFPDKRRRDTSNLIKHLEDCISRYLMYDDSCHHISHQYAALDRGNPRAVVVLAHKDRPVPAPGVIE